MFETDLSEGSVSTTIVPVAESPTARRPRSHDALTTSSASSSRHVPWEARPERNVVPGGRGSDALTFGATVGPLFVTVS